MEQHHNVGVSQFSVRPRPNATSHAERERALTPSAPAITPLALPPAIERQPPVPFGTIVAAATSRDLAVGTPQPGARRFDPALEFATGLRVIAPGITAEMRPSVNEMRVHFQTPAHLRKASSEDRGRLVFRLIDVALGDPSRIEAMRNQRVQGRTPSYPAQRTFLVFAERLSERLGVKLPRDALRGLSTAIREGIAIERERPMVVENERVKITLHSHKASLLERLSYNAKALLGQYPQASKWYEITLERKDARFSPDNPLNLSWLCGYTTKHLAPCLCIVGGCVIGLVGPHLHSMGLVWFGGTTVSVGIGLAVGALAVVNRITGRAERWFAQAQRSHEVS